MMNKNYSLYSALLRGAVADKKATAISYLGKRISYETLLKNIDLTASALVGFGIKEDDIVLISLPNIPEAAYLLYACNKIGAVAFFVHPLSSTGQLKAYFNKTKAKIAFHISAINADFSDICAKNGVFSVSVSPATSLGAVKKFFYGISHKLSSNDIDFAEFVKKYSSFDANEVQKDDTKTAILLCSGGTEGDPKIVEISARAINSLCSDGLKMLGTNSAKNKTMMSALPYFHAFGLSMGLHAIFMLGACVLMFPKFRRKYVVPYFRRSQINYMIGVPSLYSALITHPRFCGKGLKKIEVAFVGGDFTPKKLIDDFDACMRQNGSSARLFEGYGLTETVSVAFVNTFLNNKIATVGKAVSGINALINNPDSSGIGEIFLSGDNLMNGYYKNDVANESSLFVDKSGTRWFRTGDCGFLDDDGFLHFKQRIKRIIKVSGASVFPADIEDKISLLDGVDSVCVFDVPDIKTGSRVVVAVASKTAEPEALKILISKTLLSAFPPEAQPKAIYLMKELPLTKNHKIDVLAIKKLFN